MSVEPKKLNINRWIVVLLLVGIGVGASFIPPVRPEIFLAGESLMGKQPLFALPFVGDVKLTNTLLTTAILDVFIIALVIIAGRGIKVEGSKGVAGFFEMILEALYNLSESTIGKKWVRQIFPLIATIILLVLTANLMKLLPGMESIGFIEHTHGDVGYEKMKIIPHALSGITNNEIGHDGYVIVPFFRSPSTDLNFTAALALIAVFMIQVFGVRANGLAYFTKFFSFGRFIKMWTRKDLNAFDVLNPFIDIFVGILEFISEFAKIISFSFRLLGSMFGGAVLVIVLGSILPVSQFALLFLELFFGVIQALVFGVLTLVFAAIATIGHGEKHEKEHGVAQAAPA